MLFIVLSILSFIGYTCLQIYWNITAQTKEYLDERNIKVAVQDDGTGNGGPGGGGTKQGLNFSIPSAYMNKDRLENYAQQVASKVFGNTVSVDEQAQKNDVKVSRMLRFREWKDRKRTVYTGSATEAANSGFYENQKEWEGSFEHPSDGLGNSGNGVSNSLSSGIESNNNNSLNINTANTNGSATLLRPPSTSDSDGGSSEGGNLSSGSAQGSSSSKSPDRRRRRHLFRSRSSKSSSSSNIENEANGSGRRHLIRRYKNED